MNERTALGAAQALVENVLQPGRTPRFSLKTRGHSGAKTYEVTLGPHRYVVKVDAPGRSLARFRQSLRIQRAAAERGVTPPVRGWDEATRTILTNHVHDVGFLSSVFDPRRGDRVLEELAECIARLHGLDGTTLQPQPSPLEQSREMLERVATRFEVPGFATRAWDDLLRRNPASRRDTLCHLDLNPSNILFDGRKVWLVDWDTAGPGDRWLDLSAPSNLLMLDAARTGDFVKRYCAAATATAPGAPVFAEARRVTYVCYGCAFLDLVERPPIPVPKTPRSLSDCYAALRRGELDMGSDLGRYLLSAANFAAYWEVR